MCYIGFYTQDILIGMLTQQLTYTVTRGEEATEVSRAT